MKIYIASPYTSGNKEENVVNSIIVAQQIRELGHLPTVPLLSHWWDKLFPHDYEYWMAMCLEELKYCDAVLRLPGESPGADREIALARQIGITVYYEVKDVPKV